MRKRVGHSDGVTIRRDDGAAFEHAAQALNVRPGPVREIAQGSLPDLAVLAVTFAQEDGWGRLAVGDGFDVHGRDSEHDQA